MDKEQATHRDGGWLDLIPDHNGLDGCTVLGDGDALITQRRRSRGVCAIQGTVNVLIRPPHVEVHLRARHTAPRLLTREKHSVVLLPDYFWSCAR